MSPELEQLLKAWDAYIQELNGPEAERMLALFESQLEDHAAVPKVSKETLRWAIERKYKRWVAANNPKYPRLPKS